MPRNGSGTYAFPSNSFNPAVAGTQISPSVWNTSRDDLEEAVSESIARDGQTTVTANLPMAGFRHTGVGTAQARTDYAAASQITDGALVYGGTATGTANALAVTLTPAITAYVTGQTIVFKASASTNTGAATIDVNSLGTKAIQKAGKALVAGDIIASMAYAVIYDGTQFQLLSPYGAESSKGADIASAATTDLSAATGAYVQVTGTTTITALGTAKAGTFRIVTFTGALTLTHNGTSLILPGGQNIVTVAGDVATFVSEGSGNWRCVGYAYAQGFPTIVSGAVVATTSGTSVTLASGLPAGIKRITVNLDGVSTSAGDDILIQLGDSGGVETTGYVSASTMLTDATSPSVVSSASGFIIRAGAAAAVLNGSVDLTLHDNSDNTWCAHGVVIRSDAARVICTGGRKALSAVLTSVTLATSAGATFDAGEASVVYE